MLLIAIAGFAAALALGAYAILSQVQDRSVVRSSLRQLDGYDNASVENLRDQELLNPLRDRAIVPAIQRLTDLGRRFFPAGYADQSKAKLVHAGINGPDALDRFLALRVA